MVATTPNFPAPPNPHRKPDGMNWKSVKHDGYPPCDSETVFVGVNSAGYCGCFNEHGLMSTRNGQRSVCLYATAEGCSEVMTDLEWWAHLETPNGANEPTP